MVWVCFLVGALVGFLGATYSSANLKLGVAPNIFVGTLGGGFGGALSYLFGTSVVSGLGLNLVALGDYIAMVALAPLELDEDLSEVPTILNLFNARVTPPHEMTPFDESYIAALYGAPSDVEWGSIQQSAMAASMLRDARRRREAADAEIPADE